MQKILVLRGGALGDFIVTLPALAALRERWPRAVIELAGNPTAGQLALARGVIDAVHSQHERRWAGLFGDAPLPSDFADWLSRFDLVLNYWPDPDRALERRFPLRGAQRFLAGSPMPQRAPAAAHYSERLRELEIVSGENFFPLSPLPAGAGHVRTGGEFTSAGRGGDWIAIHPGSGSPRKNWPAENWRRLIEQLPLAPVSLILGDAEVERSIERVLAFPSDGGRKTHILKNRPLEELVEHFARCRLFLGHDSGISHLAAACGARCVLLFGPTDPAMWAPPAPSVRVLRSDLNALPVDAVLRAAVEALADQI